VIKQLSRADFIRTATDKNVCSTFDFKDQPLMPSWEVLANEKGGRGGIPSSTFSTTFRIAILKGLPDSEDNVYFRRGFKTGRLGLHLKPTCGGYNTDTARAQVMD
jgi:hypothetical protein